MKTDLYTKSVLTVIAAALLILVFQNVTLVHEAKADKPDFNKFASIPINKDGSINVKLIEQMDVNLKSVGGSSVYGELPVNLKEIGGTSIYSTIPVNIKELSGSSVGSNGIPVNIEAVDGYSVSSAVPVKEIK
ncbi:MAG: hypothetical protein WAQ28_11050 [Bacteroidia bacterium]|jgi:hypothetical protein